MKIDKPPLSKNALLIYVFAACVFLMIAGPDLKQYLSDGGTFKDPSYAMQRIMPAFVFAPIFIFAGIGFQFLSDIRWLLMNKKVEIDA